MTHPHPSELQTALSQAQTTLLSAVTQISTMAAGADRAHQLRLIATLLVGLAPEFRMRAVEICPDLELASPIPDTDLNEAEIETTSTLTESDIAAIDGAIVANCTSSWQPVARVIGYTLVDLKGQMPGLLLGFCARRVRLLTTSGILQYDGDLDFIRSSKVRLATAAQHSA